MRQKGDISSGVDGAQERLAAAEHLKKQLDWFSKARNLTTSSAAGNLLKNNPSAGGRISTTGCASTSAPLCLWAM